MISRSQHISGRLPPNLAVLFFITFAVLYPFAHSIPARVRQLNPDPGQLQFPVPSNAENQAAYRSHPPVKERKKVFYQPPFQQVSPPVNRTVSKLISSVLVPDTFSYAVVQQPENNPYYVSSSKDLVTEFGLARQYNNIGLIAHNNLAGNLFKQLSIGQEIHIVYDDGHVDRYTVSSVYRFRALEPKDTNSQFIDLDSGTIYSASELFERMYTGPRHVTFQTCINASGDLSWGRLFVIAVPVPTNEQKQ
jgi:hypothetical protein